MAKSPVTLGAAATVFFTSAWFQLGTPAIVLLTLAAIAALIAYWRRQLVVLDESCCRDLLVEDSLQQNMALAQIVTSLRGNGHGQYAQCLHRFVTLKQSIETELYQEGQLTPFVREVEESIASMAREVCLEISRLCDEERHLADILTSRDPQRLARLESIRHESQSAILQAYTSMAEAYGSILAYKATGRAIAAPVAGENRPAEPGKRLNEILHHLRSEAEIISRTQARLQQAVGGATGLRE